MQDMRESMRNVNIRFDRLDERMERNDQRMDRLEDTLNQIHRQQGHCLSICIMLLSFILFLFFGLNIIIAIFVVFVSFHLEH